MTLIESVPETDRGILAEEADKIHGIALDLVALEADNSSLDTTSDIAGRLMTRIGNLDLDDLVGILRKIGES